MHVEGAHDTQQGSSYLCGSSSTCKQACTDCCTRQHNHRTSISVLWITIKAQHLSPDCMLNTNVCLGEITTTIVCYWETTVLPVRGGLINDHKAMTLSWHTCKDVKQISCFGSPDLCCEKWACKKPTHFMDDSAQSQELREDDNSASEITYGEVEQRLGQLQDHLNRYVFL